MPTRLKSAVLRCMPPGVAAALRSMRRRRSKVGGSVAEAVSDQRDLKVYWDETFADDVSEWGKGNVWDEIMFFMAARNGRVLDVACGTGINIAALSRWRGLEVHGCDISDLLLDRAVKRGVAAERLTVCDASRMPYPDGSFDLGYSIGSLEHFDVSSLERCIGECRRVVTGPVFHMVPVSRSGMDEGWTRRAQSFHNNSVEWWMARFHTAYSCIEHLDSRWQDDISVGKWFLCIGE
ncbi:MAG: class I SAM-dependent methyltransferase [Lentisphaerae bacterium]|nr:class I SAM-dependent methyltransferase [Lentisphaerota bacterium]